jgi:transposase
MQVGPPLPAQPSLGFGNWSSSGKEAQVSVYVGMDVHRKRTQIAILNEDGTEVVNRNVDNGSVAMREVLEDLPQGTEVAFEAGYGWSWLLDLLQDLGHDPHLAHPGGCRAIASARL